MPKYTVEEVMEAVTAVRDEVKASGYDSARFKEVSDQVETILKESEDESQKKTLEIAAGTKANEEMKERMDVLELELSRAPQTKKEMKESDEYKCLNLFTRGGFNNPDIVGLDGKSIGDLDTKALMRMDTSTSGGYLTSTEMDTEMVKTMTEISPMRSIARVQTVGKKTLQVVKRTSIPTANYEGEAEEGEESGSGYGEETLTAFRLTTVIPFTMDQLMDSNWDLMNEINGDVSEAYAFKEGNRFVLGTGVKQPEGFNTKAELQTDALTTETASAITAKDMTDMTGLLKVGYNPIYGFNRQTLAYLRSLEDGAGNPIWQVNMADSAPNTINGEPYVLLQDMPVIADGAYPVVYADFMRGYRIIDRTGMTMIRDDVTQAAKAIVKLTFHKWNTGQVILDEAFQLLKIKAAA
jgi:HK97 family phage major capsid protein